LNDGIYYNVFGQRSPAIAHDPLIVAYVLSDDRNRQTLKR